MPSTVNSTVEPENITVSGASRFSLRSVVYDQFGALFKGNTTVQAELFAGEHEHRKPCVLVAERLVEPLAHQVDDMTRHGEVDICRCLDETVDDGRRHTLPLLLQATTTVAHAGA